MLRSFVLLLAVLFLSIPACFAGPDRALLSARETILLSSTAPHDALLKYVEASKKTISAPVIAEYAYAQAYAGLPEAALYNIDRALFMEPLDPDVRFYLSEIFHSFGLEDAASELSAPVPAWLAGKPLRLPSLDIPAPEGDFDASFVAINKLFAGKSNVRSAVLLDRMCRKFPDNSRSFARYAIALEKLGAYKAAAAQAAKNMALCKTPERKAVAAAYIADLGHRPPLRYTSSAEQPLTGRYLAFLGGSLNRADGGTAYSFSSRVGKFVSDRLDVSVNAAL